jgi:curved DNA-binding protein CbpA
MNTSKTSSSSSSSTTSNTKSSSSTGSTNNKQRETYYDILNVTNTADSKTIRQGYLKQAIKYHPDKNPNQPEESKNRFIQIGHAYEILSDSTKRSQYDYNLKWGNNNTNSNNDDYYYNNSNTSNNNNYDYNYDDNTTMDPEQIFTKYRTTFDRHVANMSESEINAVVGLASVVGGIIGSVVGSHLANNATTSNSARSCNPTGSSVLLSTFGSMAGSFISSHAAAETIRTIHQQSVERVAYSNNNNCTSQQQQQQQQDYVRNDNYNTSRQQQQQQRNTRTNNSTSNDNVPTLTLDDVASAVTAGVHLWQAYKSHK